MECKAILKDVYWSQFKFVRFQQRIPDDSQDYLVLPKDFSENVKEELVEWATLLTKKSSWDVKLKLDKGNLLLTDGWKDFVTAHVLVKNDIVIFKHVGQFRFKVSMYEGETGGQNPLSFYIRRASSPQPAAVETPSNTTERVDLEEDDQSTDPDDSSSQPARKKARQASDDRREPVGRAVPDQALRERTLRKANAMKRADDLVIYMSPTSVDQRGYGVSFSVKWARDHGLKTSQDVKLKCKGKEWDVGFYLDPTGRVAGFHRGWKKFLIETGPKLGDACILSVPARSVPDAARDCICIDVRIVQSVAAAAAAADDDDDDNPPVRNDYNGDDVEDDEDEDDADRDLPGSSQSVGKAGKAREPTRKGFTASLKDQVMRKAKVLKEDGDVVVYVNKTCAERASMMNVPTIWARDHGLTETQDVEFRWEGEAWPVKFYVAREGRLTTGFSKGWKKFVIDTSIKAGDVCIFGVLPRSDEGDDQGCVCINVRIVRL